MILLFLIPCIFSLGFAAGCWWVSFCKPRASDEAEALIERQRDRINELLDRNVNLTSTLRGFVHQVGQEAAAIECVAESCRETMAEASRRLDESYVPREPV